MAKRRLVMLAATVVVAALAAAAVIVALGDTAETPAPATPTVVLAAAATPTAVMQPPATRTPAVLQPTPRPVATTAGTSRPTATPLATPIRPLTLSTAPALKAPDRTETLQPPPSPFTDHDGRSIVLFDTEARAQHDFGTGNLSASAFGRDSFTYVDAAGEAWLLRLPSLDRTSLGRATSSTFVDEHRIQVGNGPSALLFDTRTSVTTPLSSLSQAQRHDLDVLSMARFEPPQLSLLRGMTRRDGTINVADDPCARITGNSQRLCWDARPEDVVLQDASGRIVYSFRALRVLNAGPSELLIATPPVCTDSATSRSLPCIELFGTLGNKELDFSDPDFATGTTNLYILDLTQDTASFIATARYNLINDVNWPVAADANAVIWTDAFCAPQPGKTRIYDRKAGTLTELAQRYWFLLRNGKLGLGEFGFMEIVDPVTLQYLAVLPSVQGDVRWSSDYRYAAVTAPLGHGGLCR